jgi:hypothetical protein
MHKDDVLHFLQAIDDELATHAVGAETLDLYLLGRSALILRYGLSLATKDVDLVTDGNVSRLQALAFELFGKGTHNAQALGLYLEAVPAGLPPLPGNYRDSSTELPGRWKVLRPRQIDVHHLAITKLKRFHAGDREDVRILCDSGDLTSAGLADALDSAFPFGLDEEEDRDHQRVMNHYRKVNDYLEGRTRDL